MLIRLILHSKVSTICDEFALTQHKMMMLIGFVCSQIKMSYTSDDQDFASTILWLEDQKIRHYKIEDRETLRNIDDFVAWSTAFEKYKSDIGVPKFGTRIEDLEWILSYAVRLEYMDRSDDYKHITAALVEEAKKPADPTLASKNPFDAMDMKCDDFEQGVRRLGQILNIANHPDHLKVMASLYVVRPV